VKCLTFYDIVLDFIVLDAFEDLENPPSSVIAVVQNRWLTDGFKETVREYFDLKFGKHYLQLFGSFQGKETAVTMKSIISLISYHPFYSEIPKCFLPPRFGNKTSHLFSLSGFLSATKIKIQKAKLPVTPQDAGFQIVSPNTHSSYLQGEERSQIETVSTRLELIRFFTGDNTSSQFALVVNLARQSSLRANYSIRGGTLVWNS
ncbi:hypothetical protein CEXT_241751, partial [Caerostris extrusa]